MEESVIRLENVSFSYDQKLILENINLNIKRGMFLGLVGPNGGGKSTLIKIILGLLKPDHGKIFLLDKPIHKFSEWNKIGFVSQKANAFNKGFPATVFEVVSMGLTTKLGLFKFFSRENKKQVLEAIKRVEMEKYAYENIGDLSGGQQQRIFIARALVSEPEILILDEPTVGIDYKYVEQFYKLLRDLNQKENITMLLVSHDTGVMTEYATSVACLNKTLHFHGHSSEYNALSQESLSEIYGHPVKLVVHNHG